MRAADPSPALRDGIRKPTALAVGKAWFNHPSAPGTAQQRRKAGMCAVPGGLDFELNAYPPLKRWAIIFRARGARVVPVSPRTPSPTSRLVLNGFEPKRAFRGARILSGEGHACLRDAISLAGFRSLPEIRYRLPGLWPRVLPWLRRDRHTRPRLPSSPWSRDGSSSISVAMPSPTGLPDEFSAFASLSTQLAEPGIQKAGPPVSGGCSNIFLFLECRRRRPRCNAPARWPKRSCGQRE